MNGASETELAWAAGFFDGEGCCYTAKMGRKSGGKYLHLDIAQVDRFVLDRFHRAVGGVGKVYGPYQPKTPRSRAYYRYTASGQAACQSVISSLWDYLSPVKREQAERSLQEFHEHRTRKTTEV